MFDYIVEKRTDEPAKPRYMTTTVSLGLHLVALVLAVGLPILYASDDLPEPPDMMAFVVSELPPPPPPPPPPAPAPETPKPSAAAKPSQPAVEVPKPIANANPVAAPVEAPAAIKPETGLEGATSSGASKIEAGFERGMEGGVVGGAVGGVETGAPPPPPPPPPPKPTGPVRVGGKVKAPALVDRVNPAYPPMAQAAQVEGSVVLEATVDKSGAVRSVRVVRGHPLLDAAAMAAVRQWRYEPLLLNGEPMEFILTVTVNFSMPR